MVATSVVMLLFGVIPSGKYYYALSNVGGNTTRGWLQAGDSQIWDNGFARFHTIYHDETGVIGFDLIDEFDSRLKFYVDLSDDIVYHYRGGGLNPFGRVMFSNFWPIGDSSQDGVFGTQDLIMAFAGGSYDRPDLFATWEQGDWNGDTSFNTSDLVAAFQYGDYDGDAIATVVPEPGCGWLAVIGLVVFRKYRAWLHPIP